MLGSAARATAEVWPRSVSVRIDLEGSMGCGRRRVSSWPCCAQRSSTGKGKCLGTDSDTISDMSPGPKVAEVISARRGVFPLAPQPRGQVC